MAIFSLLLGLLYSFLHILSSFFSPPIHQHPPRKLPPGPRAIPVIGNLHMLGTLPHRNLQTLAQKYGPILSIRLGLVPTIVVSSPALAELVLKKHDTVFASRPKTHASEYLNYGTNGIGFTEYGPYWRYVRKVCTLQLLSSSRIVSFGPLRKQEMNLIVEQVRNAAERHEVVDLTEKVSELVKEVTFKMIVGIDNKIDSVDFRQLVEEGMRLIVTFNLADYVPYLGALDIQVRVYIFLNQ
ncbi:Cytochrome P450, E-class, group I [Parasponia andersonii]|uniref:Cytochrome P450, E-class, group I n=1 Tax=Parasponia andersonii TaxID=3476 RepID=A0A2P5BGH2_PARAD|nr:Cytochrome P450, E-class, group I [Parasponia andersonii]